MSQTSSAVPDARDGVNPARALAAEPRLRHSGLTLTTFFTMQMTGAVFPLAAALIFYGWRAAFLIVLVVGSAWLALGFWKNIGSRGVDLRLSHITWLALLLAMTLPAHLVSSQDPFGDLPPLLWTIPIGAGVLIVILAWILGGIGSSRVHPVLVTYLLLVAIFQHNDILQPHWVLQRDHIVSGDVARAPDVDDLQREAQSDDDHAALARDTQNRLNNFYKDGWISQKPNLEGYDAVYLEPASAMLTRYTSGRGPNDPDWLSLESMLRDRMPPLEDLIVGGQPGPIGASSAIAVIVGGLFLIYKGVIDFRVPLFIVMGAMLAFVILPIPMVLADSPTKWHWLAFREPAVQWSEALTFANYELMAGPLLFTAFFLATAPAVRPMARRARVIYALSIGVLAAVMQLYVAVSFGAYLAMLIASLLTPTFDKIFRPRALV